MELEEALAKISELETSVESVVGKNKELLHELKVTKAKAKEVDPEEHAALLTKVEELSSENKKLKSELGGQVETLTQTAKEKSEKLEKYLIEGKLTQTLMDADVHKDYFEAVFAMKRGQVTLSENDEVMLGDKPIEEAIKEWSESDKAKPFLAAKANVGGGSFNADGSTSFTGKKFKDMNDSERLAFKQADPDGFRKAMNNL
jgi:hypothetical protein